MPLPSWELSKEIADKLPGKDGSEDDLKCPECGQDLKDDELSQSKGRPK